MSHLRERQAKTVEVESLWVGENAGEARIESQDCFAMFGEIVLLSMV